MFFVPCLCRLFSLRLLKKIKTKKKNTISSCSGPLACVANKNGHYSCIKYLSPVQSVNKKGAQSNLTS